MIRTLAASALVVVCSMSGALLPAGPASVPTAAPRSVAPTAAPGPLDGRLVVIDLPQVVDLVANPRGPEFLERDVRNVAGWFTARGLSPELAEPREVTEMLLDLAGLR